MPRSTIRLRIENVVAKARLGGPFELPELARRLREVDYRPERFLGLVVRVPQGHALVFEDGGVVVTGATGVEEALVQLEHVRELLAQAGADTTGVEGFRVRNLVVSTDLGGDVPLDQVELAFPDEDIEYDTSQFPGLIMHLKEPRMTLLVFQSGKVVATGSHDMPAVQEALEGFYQEMVSRRLVMTEEP
jgi:transcription initiation factor TFIID TATA-box-binding protein